MCVMEPTKVWAVQIGVGTEEVRGTLSLEETELVLDFAEDEATLRIPLAEIRGVKRVRGSPVLVVDRENIGGRSRLAFFFAKPPPLKTEERGGKRKAKRQAVIYLNATNRDLVDDIRNWERALQEVVREARA